MLRVLKILFLASLSIGLSIWAVVHFLTPARPLSDPDWIRKAFEECRLDNSGECAEDLEKKSLPKYHAKAQRNGKTLILKTKQKDLELKNEGADIDASISYYFYLGFIEPVGYHVVLHHFYESYRILMISWESGAQTEMPEIPAVSPSGLKVASVAADDTGLGERVIKVWDVKPKGMTLEFDYPTQLGSYDFDSWASDDLMHLKYAPFERGEEECHDKSYKVVYEDLALRFGRWTLVPIKPENSPA